MFSTTGSQQGACAFQHRQLCERATVCGDVQRPRCCCDTQHLHRVSYLCTETHGTCSSSSCTVEWVLHGLILSERRLDMHPFEQRTDATRALNLLLVTSLAAMSQVLLLVKAKRRHKCSQAPCFVSACLDGQE